MYVVNGSDGPCIVAVRLIVGARYLERPLMEVLLYCQRGRERGGNKKALAKCSVVRKWQLHGLDEAITSSRFTYTSAKEMVIDLHCVVEEHSKTWYVHTK